MLSILEDDPRPPLWDRPYIRRRILSTRPEAVEALIAAFESDPRTSGLLSDIRHDPPPEPHARLLLSATWLEDDTPVYIKLNADPWEIHWMGALSERAPEMVPRVFAGGESIGSYEVGWLAMERIAYSVSHDWGDVLYDRFAAAAVRFQQIAQAIDRRGVALVCLHATVGSIERALSAGCPGPLPRLLERLEHDWAWVNGHCGTEVCFGDLTMGNTLSRTPLPTDEPILLIDPLPRMAPWAWDGAYCQTLDANSDVRLIHRMAAERQARDLPVPGAADLDRIAALLLAWLAAHRWWSVAFRREDPEWCGQIERYIKVATTL